MGVLHMPTAAGHHPLKSCPRHEAPPQIILKSVTFTMSMTTESPSPSSLAPPPTPCQQRAWCNLAAYVFLQGSIRCVYAVY